MSHNLNNACNCETADFLVFSILKFFHITYDHGVIRVLLMNYDITKVSVS